MKYWIPPNKYIAIKILTEQEKILIFLVREGFFFNSNLILTLLIKILLPWMRIKISGILILLFSYFSFFLNLYFHSSYQILFFPKNILWTIIKKKGMFLDFLIFMK